MPMQQRVPALAPDALTGRVVLLVGAAGGLGRASALACGRVGATVVLLGRHVRALEALYDELLAAGAPQPAIYPLNLEGATPRDYATLAETLARDLGGVDAVAFTAARFDGLTPLELIEPEVWLSQIQVNLSAPLLIVQALLPLLRQRADGAIAFVLEDPARMRRAHWGGYGVAKCALEGLFAILAEEHHEGPLRVHALLPAPMRTALRRLAYFGEHGEAQPEPTAAGAALAALLGSAAAPLRGQVLDLRAPD
ncbi:SDR family NAD(P)-dependent oxidoreductase [Metallibacterium sp.]|uniref:SDR family NAD(P)-dependent oxidoreductase n=1 Tax=Metallibacterium sp. TaxID=2940281 RepID=UPI0031BBAE3A